MVEATNIPPSPEAAAKTATSAATNTFESMMPKFDMTGLEVPAAFREMAEKSVQSARENYEKMKSSAEETTDLLEDTYTTASKGVAEYNTVALEALRSNVNSAFDYMAALFTARSMSEAVELSSGHMRKQFDTLSAQARELSVIAQKVATETAEPIKASVEKNIKKSV